MVPAAGKTLDKYDVLEEVGHGGMAVVYRGLDRVLRREVAIKVLHPHLADRDESRLRLQREAIAVAKIRHENILEIFDYSGVGAGESYIVTEFIHGPTLRQWLDDGYQPRPIVAAMIVARLAQALGQAHSAGIIHRDIKPENVMVRRDDGCLKLMDFGIAQILDNQKLTMTGQLIGSPAYMAPELINGQPVDGRTDLFSLGILLYQLATGHLPFTGRNPHEVLNRIADGSYPAPSTLCPLVDADLEAIIQRALMGDPARRFQDADTMARELQRYVEDLGMEGSAVDLRAYFRDPQGFVDDLDAHVIGTLLTRAHQACRDGSHPRAIRLLARILELDQGHREARALLQRLRIRERRMRQILMGAGALAFAGLIGAGAVLIPGSSTAHPDQRMVKTSPAADPTSLAATQALASEDHAPAEPLGRPIPSASEPTANPLSSPSLSAPSTAKLPRDPGLRLGHTSSQALSPQGRPAAERHGPKTLCMVNLTGIGISPARNVELRVGNNVVPVNDLVMKVEFEGDESEVRINDRRWVARQRIDRSSCAKGPVDLVVRPKPARLLFRDAPVDMAVVCTAGCPQPLMQRPYLAKYYPEIRFEPGSAQRRIHLTLKHPDYEELRLETVLGPGDNDVPVRMLPRP